MQNNEEVNKALRLLKDAGVDDVEKYADLHSEKERIESELLKYEEVEKKIYELGIQINDRKKEIRDLIVERYQKRNNVICSWNALGTIRLKLMLFGNLEYNEQRFRTIIRKGSGYDQEILSEKVVYV